jgi:hypothetical protein
LTLRDHTLVLAGDFGRPQEACDDGSDAGRLVDLKGSNPERTVRTHEAFVRHVLAGLPTLPRQHVDIEAVNVGLLPADALACARAKAVRP